MPDAGILHAPALRSADRLGKKSQRPGPDRDDPTHAAARVEEEWQELKTELAPGADPNPERIREEIGDLLFAAAQLSRRLGIDPEQALRDSNRKFLDRFSEMEGEQGHETQEDLDQSHSR